MTTISLVVVVVHCRVKCDHEHRNDDAGDRDEPLRGVVLNLSGFPLLLLLMSMRYHLICGPSC